MQYSVGDDRHRWPGRGTSTRKTLLKEHTDLLGVEIEIYIDVLYLLQKGVKGSLFFFRSGCYGIVSVITERSHTTASSGTPQNAVGGRVRLLGYRLRRGPARGGRAE